MKCKKGFTLIEVVLAVSVLSIMGLAMLNLFMSATKTNNDIKRKLKAGYMAQKIMESEKAHKEDYPDESEIFYDGDGSAIEIEEGGVADTRGYVAKVGYEKPEGVPEDMQQDIFQIRVRVYYNGKVIEEISSLARKDKKEEDEGEE